MPSDNNGPSAGPPPRQVVCPICLARIDWGNLSPFRWDKGEGKYVPMTFPSSASPEQREHLMGTISWRCPNPTGDVAIHFLPAAYGQYGEPAVFGFIGATSSGKTHLLASMVGAIESGELHRYGLTAAPVDRGRHRTFMTDSVIPLLNSSTVLKATREGVITFADAFLVGQGAAEPRPIAIFDVAGEELRKVDDAKRFLNVATGFVFVVDPNQFGKSKLGDQTFNVVLEILQSIRKLDSVSAVVVLNKADQLKFDEPVALWLRRADNGLDTGMVVEESADVYAYLHSRGADAWARPFRECGNATLHFASATGVSKGDELATTYPRPVRPQRVLAPLLSLMAMAGVITAPGTGA